MSEKYLIDKSSLTALADITRAYNETPDKEYSLAEVTEQVRKASENYYNLFGEGLTLLESETATQIKAYTFGGCALSTQHPLSINLPNAFEVNSYALMSNYLDVVKLPSVETIYSGAFSKCTITRGLYFPSLKRIVGDAFDGLKRMSNYPSTIYMPNLESISPTSFKNTGTLKIILKNIPTLSALPEWHARNAWLVPPGKLEEFKAATNWGDVKLQEATTFDMDKSSWWIRLIYEGIISEAEIRSDYYGEEI